MSTIVEAPRWAKKTAGHVGPRGYRRNVAVSQFNATLEDHLEEGWGLPEKAGDDEEWLHEVELPIDAARADLYMQALVWVGHYLIRAGHPATGKIVSICLTHSITRNTRAFEAALRREGISRSHAYRLKDKGLSIIAAGLWRDGVPIPPRQTLSE